MKSTKEKKTGQPEIFKMFIIFFRIGLFTFGGGLAMIAVIRHELISQEWLTDEEFVDSLSIATALPGAIAVNTSLIVGYKVRGALGAVTALAGSILPSFIIILLIGFFFLRYFNTNEAQLFFKGAGAAVAGLIAYSAFEMGKTILKSWKHLLLSSIGVILGLTLQINLLWIVLLSAIAGYFLCGKVENDITNG